MKTRQLKVGCTYFKESRVPLIRLSGDWLTKQGFGFGQKVTIQETPGQLVIQLAREVNQ